MDPIIWGPKLWFVIHTFALNYPENPTYEDKRLHEDFFNNLVFLIPCNKCRIHYRNHLNKYPVINYLDNSDNLFKYTIKIHNEVNKTLNKRVYSYEEVVKFYRSEYGQTNLSNTIFNKQTCIYIIIILLIICVSYLLYKKYPRRIIYI